MFSDDFIARVRDHTDIVDLISGYVALKKAGRNHLGLCPFHSEKTPSFTVSQDKQMFYCFGCHAGGNVFTFVQRQDAAPFHEAVKKLAERAGIEIPRDSREDDREHQARQQEKENLLRLVSDAARYYRHQLASDPGVSARTYLADRGVSDETQEAFGLGYAVPEWDSLLNHLKKKGHAAELIEKAGLAVRRNEGTGWYDRFRGRIIFPIRNLTGETIAFGGRVMDTSLPKYLNSPETRLYSKSHELYCLDQAKEHAKKVGYFIIVEGYLDALACHQYGAKSAVATLGTALTEGHLRLMKRFARNLVLIFDPDPAGIKAALRGFDLLVDSGMKANVVILPDGDDPDTFLKKNGYDSFAAHLKQSQKLMDFVLRQICTAGPFSPIDERAAQAQEMLRYISRLPTSIERDHYLKRTAEALHVEESSLRADAKTVVGRPKAPTATASRGATQEQRMPRAEEIAFHILLKSDSARNLLGTDITAADFSDPLLQRAVTRIAEMVAATGSVHIDALMSGDEDELLPIISRFSVLEMTYDDVEKTLRDCVSVLRQKDPEEQMKQIVRALKDAEARGNHDEYRELLRMQQELSRRPGRRIPGL